MNIWPRAETPVNCHRTWSRYARPGVRELRAHAKTKEWYTEGGGRCLKNAYDDGDLGYARKFV